MQVAFLKDQHQIPEELILNSDQTGVPLTPSTNYNWVPKGSKGCTGTGYGDKRQYTATPTTAMSGEMLALQVKLLLTMPGRYTVVIVILESAEMALFMMRIGKLEEVCCLGMTFDAPLSWMEPDSGITNTPDELLCTMQVIYQGKTTGSLPDHSCRRGSRWSGWDWCYTENHWSNLECMKSLVQKIVVPYAKRTIERLGLPANQKIIWIIDAWSVHKSVAFRDYMHTNHPYILLLFIPPNCTSKLQPQDVSVQKPFKSAVTAAFRYWQQERYTETLQKGAYTILSLCKIFMYSCVHTSVL